MNKIKINFKITYEDIILGIVIVCALVLLIIVFMKFNNSYKNKVINDTNMNDSNIDDIKSNIDYNNPALYHSTKSVDGENQFNMDTKWKSQPSKCFDCESQMEATCGNACVYNATKQKLF
jgi:hypothetical protein